VSLTNLSSGSHSYSVTQTDAAGNVSPPMTVTWSIDTSLPSAPTVTRSSPTGTPTNSTSQTITYSGIESGGAAQCKLDGAAYAACGSSPFTLNGLAGGAHTVSVTQTDSAGNVSPAGTVTWTVDTVAPNAPTVTRTSPTANPTTSASQTVTYSGAEPGGTFQCKLDSAPFSACPGSPISISALTDGTHSYSITQTDAAGNISAEGTVDWVVDTTAPTAPSVTRTSPSTDPTSVTAQTFSIGGESGNSFECKLDQGSYAPCGAGAYTVTGLALGTHTLAVKQTDGAGNTSPPAAIAWTVVAPTLELPAPIDPTGPTGAINGLSAKISSLKPQTLVPAPSGLPFSLKSHGSKGSFRVDLSTAATVSVRLERIASGMASRASAWAKFKLKAGKTTIYFTGRAGTKALAPGTYKVHLKATGAKADAFSSSFKIKR
jgi:hypothetical protein